ncbi:hypothetical protein BLNAU_22560 [Blattamonas nauphoetae]|uniref:Uncharacterized protein n=1 Tax=Blattamonas nauphoetae TaxID=2049346 RepID=A0ABQ9WSQ7_9EUKA|nr:hypothetical protein BLNAU_22560 [Blattamonas nauphoetae]
MTTFDRTINTSSGSTCPDCCPFLNWDEKKPESEDEQAVIFHSLVATVKFLSALDVSLEAKAMKYIKYIHSQLHSDSERFINSLGQTPDESLTNFAQSMVVLISTPNRAITTTMMKILKSLISFCSRKVRLALVKADLIPQLIASLKPLTLSFVEAVNIHVSLSIIIHNSLWLVTPFGLTELKIQDRDEQQAVHETVSTQVLIPSEKYISHLCVNRFSIIDWNQSKYFMELLAQLIRISPCYQPTMDFILHLPVVLTIPSYLSFIENDSLIWYFLWEMIDAQLEWNDQSGKVRQMWKTVHRMLRMEGIEGVVEQKLQNDQNEYDGRDIVFTTMNLNNLLGMNVPKPWNDWDSLSPVSLDGRHTLLLLRRQFLEK